MSQAVLLTFDRELSPAEIQKIIDWVSVEVDGATGLLTKSFDPDYGSVVIYQP